MTSPETRLERAQMVADLLDTAFELPVVGTKVGLDNVTGLIPGYGDALASIFSFYILYEATRAGVPKTTLFRMLGNILVDTGIGLLPFFGGVADIVFKSNRKNVELFEKHLEIE
jgi:hypothetical protein